MATGANHTMSHIQPYLPSEAHVHGVNKNPEAMKAAMEAGADHNLTDVLDQTALIFCVRQPAEDEAQAEKLTECTKILIDAGTDVNTPDKYGDTPLILAIMDGGGVAKTAAVKLLIDAGADVLRVCDNFKMTPLHWAALGGHLEICKLLVAAGARKNKIDRQRLTPIQVAKKQLERLNENLDAFGFEYDKKYDDLPQQKAKYKEIIPWFESLPGIKLD